MKIKVFSLALMATLFLASCTKDDDDSPAPDPTYPVEGLWVGTYKVNELPAVGPLPYSFAFSPDHTVVTAGKGDDGKIYYAAGSWTMSDSVITATYTTLNYGAYQVKQSSTLTYHNDGTITNGTWTDVENPAGHLSGTFQNLKRVN